MSELIVAVHAAQTTEREANGRGEESCHTCTIANHDETWRTPLPRHLLETQKYKNPLVSLCHLSYRNIL